MASFLQSRQDDSGADPFAAALKELRATWYPDITDGVIGTMYATSAIYALCTLVCIANMVVRAKDSFRLWRVQGGRIIPATANFLCLCLSIYVIVSQAVIAVDLRVWRGHGSTRGLWAAQGLSWFPLIIGAYSEIVGVGVATFVKAFGDTAAPLPPAVRSAQDATEGRSVLARIHERLKGHIAFNVTVIVLFPLILAIGVLVPTFMAETTCGRVFALFRQAEGLALQGEAELQASGQADMGLLLQIQTLVDEMEASHCERAQLASCEFFIGSLSFLILADLISAAFLSRKLSLQIAALRRSARSLRVVEQQGAVPSSAAPATADWPIEPEEEPPYPRYSEDTRSNRLCPPIRVDTRPPAPYATYESDVIESPPSSSSPHDGKWLLSPASPAAASIRSATLPRAPWRSRSTENVAAKRKRELAKASERSERRADMLTTGRRNLIWHSGFLITACASYLGSAILTYIEKGKIQTSGKFASLNFVWTMWTFLAFASPTVVLLLWTALSKDRVTFLGMPLRIVEEPTDTHVGSIYSMHGEEVESRRSTVSLVSVVSAVPVSFRDASRAATTPQISSSGLEEKTLGWADIPPPGSPESSVRPPPLSATWASANVSSPPLSASSHLYASSVHSAHRARHPHWPSAGVT